jgi:hypothetical protein
MKTNRWNMLVRAPEGDSGGAGGEGSAGGGAGGSSIIAGGAGGEGAKPWFNDLPPEFQGNPYVAQTKDLASFVKSAIDTKSMVGADTIKLPGKNATDAERAEFYTKLGRPAEATAYTPTVQPVAESLVDPNVLTFMQGEIHKLGLSEAQGKGILDAYLSQVNVGYEAQTAAMEAAKLQGISTLKQEWGPKFDNNVKTAQLAITQHGGPELMAKIDAAGLGNDIDFIKMMHVIGTKLLDDDATGEGGGQFNGSSMQAAAEIERLKLDTDFQTALNSATHPGHKAAVDKWLAVHRQATPGKQEE